MSKKNSKAALEPSLRHVWRRTQKKHVSAGLLALARWGVPLFLTGMTLDWFAYLPTNARVLVLLIVVSISFFQAWRKGWQYLRAFDPTLTALEIEDRLGGMESLLVTAVQFEKKKKMPSSSESLRQITRQNAELAAGKLEAKEIVDFSILRGPVIIAFALTSMMLIFALNDGPFLLAGLKRIFTPWTQIAYPTDTQIELAQEELVIKEGGAAEILISVSGIVPSHATLHLRTGESSERKLEIEIIDNQGRYAIASASREFSYQVRAGDARSDWRKVRIISPPVIEQVDVEMEYPKYLNRPSEEVKSLTLSVPEDTTVRWQISLDIPVQKAFLNLDGEEPKRLEINQDGQLFVESKVDASRGYNFSWVEQEHGFDFISPRYFLQVASDQPPRVELVAPANNLIALVGRPINFSARVSDDHEIDSSVINYRVNSREEESVSLETPLKNGGGEQPIYWDYRKTLPGLKIGDTVSFLLQVSDKYPDGPHIVRSETRRLTLLSRDDYLEQIGRKIDRLLSRVQSTYRQQRGAFESVSSLDPKQIDYLQSCQVEAIRQELLRDQLKGIAGQLKELLDDLAVNQVSDAREGESLETIRSALNKIADTHLADAASGLRQQTSIATSNKKESPNPYLAAHAVNAGARDLASIVLLRGIDSAQEVFAREVRMLAEVQASLRWRLIQTDSVETRKSLLREQLNLIEWTNRLLNNLKSGMRYDKRPLAVLRLTQSIKNFQRTHIQEQMQKAAEWIKQGNSEDAQLLQSEIVTSFLDSEFSVRLSGAYSTLIKSRDEIRSILKSQKILLEQCSVTSNQEFEDSRDRFKKAQIKLRERLNTILLHSVLTPRSKLMDEKWPVILPVRKNLRNTELFMKIAVEQISSGKRDAFILSQTNALKTLLKLSKLVDQWAVELGLRTLGLGTLVSQSSDRLSFIEQIEARVVTLWDKTDEAALDDKNVTFLAEDQRLLAEELSSFNSDLLKNSESNEDRDAQPLLNRMKRAETALLKAIISLEKNNADEAIDQQGIAADILAESLLLVTAQTERIDLLQSLLMFQRSVGFAIGYLEDISAEQRDLMASTESLNVDATSSILPMLKNQVSCIKEVAPLLFMLASRIDTGTPLAFAISDLEDAASALIDGDKLDSTDAQDVAIESLEEVNQLVVELRNQAGYLAEIVEFLHGTVANIAILESQQEELALQAEITQPDDEKYNALDQKQRTILKLAEKEGKVLEMVTGIKEYSEPAMMMNEALDTLKKIDAPAAAGHMWLAKEALAENAESLFAVIRMLHGLPQVEITVRTDPALKRLVNVLAVATDQKILFRDLNQADKGLPKAAIAVRQGELTSRCEALAQNGERHIMLDSALNHMNAATGAFMPLVRDAIEKHQKAAMESLRHFIIEQALILETAVPPPTPQDGSPEADGPDSDSESEFSAGFLAEFVSGEAPKDQRTGWNVLGDRNRAALNQNFARELPLEYRGLLKNYYERIAK